MRRVPGVFHHFAHQQRSRETILLLSRLLRTCWLLAAGWLLRWLLAGWLLRWLLVPALGLGQASRVWARCEGWVGGR